MPYSWKIELNSVDISNKVDYFSILCSLNNFCRELTFNIIDKSIYDALDFTQLSESPEIEVFTKITDTFISQGKFYLERPTFIEELNSEMMRGVWGRSETAALAEPFAPKVKKVWETKTTFYTICQEMCDLVGFTWNQTYSEIDDFVIYPYTYEADNLYPIDVISELATLAGAKVTTDRNGNLCIKENNFSPTSEAHTFTDSEVNTIRENRDWPTFANRIRITPTGSVSNYSIELFTLNDCLRADYSSKTKLFAQVKDPDGNPVSNVVVNWAQSSSTADLVYDSSNTQEVIIQNERQQATGFHSFQLDLPASSIIGVYAYTDTAKEINLAADGYSIDGNTVTLTKKLSYCDQSLIITYNAAGIAVNYLQAGFAADDVTVIADVEGQRASIIIYIENPCKCPPSINLTASPTSMTKNEIAKLLVYVEESGPVTTGRVVFMSEGSKVKKGSLSWTTTKLGQVTITKEKTKARNEIAGLTQCEIGMFPASVTSVYLNDGDGNQTGNNLYVSHEGKTINLSTILLTETDLLVNYIAQGAALNLFTGSKIGVAQLNAYIITTSENSQEDNVEIQISDKSQITDDYPPDWGQGDDDGGYEDPGGYSDDWEDKNDTSLCLQSDGTKVECGSGERCCSDGNTVGCHPDSECVGGDIDPCWPASISGEPNESVLSSRFDTGLEHGCSCSEMCNNEFSISETTQDYDGASGNKISTLALSACACEEGSAEYWEKYAELKDEAIQECINTCECQKGLEWDSDNNPETISGGSSVDIFVLNGLAPYTWSVSGNGYSVLVPETNAGANTISCIEGTCGIDYDVSVSVTITDSCGNTANGTLRNASGQWVLIDECDPEAWDGAGVVELIDGIYKYQDDWCESINGGTDCNHNCLGGPCTVHTDPPTPSAGEIICQVESSKTYEWQCS